MQIGEENLRFPRKQAAKLRILLILKILNSLKVVRKQIQFIIAGTILVKRYVVYLNLRTPNGNFYTIWYNMIKKTKNIKTFTWL